MLQLRQVNQNIKLIRELSGKKQEKFAELIKTNLSNLKTYENTNVRPKAIVLAAIADYAGITVEDLENKKLTHKDLKFGSVEKDEVDKVEEPAVPYENKNLSLTDQLIKAMIQVMERQNEILKENKDVYIGKVESISLHIEAVRKNQDTLVIDIKGSLDVIGEKLQVVEKIVTEKFASLSQQMTDVGSKAFLHEFPKKDKSVPVRRGDKSDK